MRPRSAPDHAEERAHRQGRTDSLTPDNVPGDIDRYPILVVRAYEILAVCLIAMVGAASAWFDWPTIVRVLFGIPLVLFCPGFALVGSLFPDREGIDWVERIGLSFGLSIALVAPQALLLSYIPGGIQKESILVSLCACVLAFSTIALVRRGQLEQFERFELRWWPRLPANPREWPRSKQLLVTCGVLTLVVVIASALASIGRPQADSATEFAVLTDDGNAHQYQRDLVVGQPYRLLFQISNGEDEETEFRIDVSGVGRLVGEPPVVRLKPGEAWSDSLQYEVTQTGTNIPVRFELRRVGLDSMEDAPYRVLELFVVSREGSAGASSTRDHAQRPLAIDGCGTRSGVALSSLVCT